MILEKNKQPLGIPMDRYIESANRIREKGIRLDPFANWDRLGQFSFFSANMANFLPLVDYAKHLPLYREAYINQCLNRLDEQYFGDEVPLAINGWDHDKITDLLRCPSIICTLHAGSYRMITYLLTNSRIPFAVLMSKQAMQKQGDGFKGQYAKWHAQRGIQADLPIIDAESPRAIWEMIRLVKSGYHLLVYLDGFTGLPTPPNELQRIPFFAQHMLVRKGVVFLAHKLGLPLMPVLCLRGENTIEVVYDTPLKPGSSDLGQYSNLALTYMFSFFGSHLTVNPAQWENWFFLHNQLDTKKLHVKLYPTFMGVEDGGNALPQPDRYGVYKRGGRYFLLEKWGYVSYELKREYAEGLIRVWKQY